MNLSIEYDVHLYYRIYDIFSSSIHHYLNDDSLFQYLIITIASEITDMCENEVPPGQIEEKTKEELILYIENILNRIQKHTTILLEEINYAKHFIQHTK